SGQKILRPPLCLEVRRSTLPAALEGPKWRRVDKRITSDALSFSSPEIARTLVSVTLDLIVQSLQPQEPRTATQLFLDAQQLVVFGDAVGTRRRPSLDLPDSRGHREVCDERVFGFARAV